MNIDRFMCHKRKMNIDDEIRAETLQDSVCLVNKVCSVCKAVGRWNVDEENSNIIVCECGEEQILSEEIEARSLDK